MSVPLAPGTHCFLLTALVPHHEKLPICFLCPFGSSQISTLSLSAGLYACKGGSNSPCLVYVSFNQKIYIYWDVQLERMESTNLLKILDCDPEFGNLLQQLGVERSDVSAVKDLIHKTLYFPEKQQQSSPSQCQDPAGTDSSAHYTVIQDPL